MKFRLNFGEHQARGADGQMVTYRRGATIETTHDLTKEFGIVDVEHNLCKFTRVDDVVPARPNFKRGTE